MYRRVVLALWVLVTCGWISQSAVAQSNESLLFIKPGSMLDQRLIPANNDLLVLNDKCTINQHNGKVTDISRCPAGIYNYESKVKKNTINNKVINDIESLIKTTQKDISDEQSNKEERCRPYQVEETVWSWQLLWGWYYIYWPSVEQVTKKICSDEVKNPKLVIQLQQALEVAIKIRDTLNSITNSHYGYDHLITNFGYDIQALEKHYESLTDVLESSKRNELIAQLQELLSPPIPQVYRIAVHQGHAIMEFKGISTDENTLQYQLACPLVSDSPQPILEETLNIGGKWTNNNPSAGYSDIDKFYKSNPTYVFTVKESVTLQIDLGYDGTYIDTYLSIRDVENSTRYEDDDGGDGRNSRITQQFAPGVYEIAAGTYSNMQIGAFKLKIEKVSKDGTVFLSRSTSNVSDNSQNLCDQLVPTNSRVSIISSQTEEVYQANISFSKAERKEGWLDIAIDLRQKLYTLQTNHNSQYKVLLQASFGQVHQNGSNVIELRSLNRAPVLTNLALAGITDEDTAYNIPIVQLLQDAGVQYEAKEPRRGIYINSNTGRGSWEYCQSSSCQKILNNSWLRADNDSRLRYQPDGKNGETAQLTFSAWDQSDQTMGSVSTQTARLILDVNDINDPVTISTNGFFMPMTEDQWSELKVAQTSIKFEDPDSDDSDQYFLTLEVSAGHLRYTKQELSLGEQEGSKIILSGSLSQLQQAIQSSIQYKHLTEHYFGEDQLTLTLSEEKDRYSSAQQDYSITINPVNDLPKFASSANSKVTLTIDENQSTGHVVANHPTASDVDGDVLTYQLRGENGAFSIVGGNIVANQSLDYESKALYKLILEAVDAANGVALIDIEIDVNNLLEKPIATTPNPGLIKDSVSGDKLETKNISFVLIVNDPDKNDTLTYSIQGQSDNKLKGVYGTLTVDSKEGIYTYVPFEKTLDTINGLSFNQSQTDTFTLVVKDDAGLTDSTNYKVNLINQNNPPGVRPPECFTQAGNKPVDDLFDDGKYQCEVEINDPDTQTTSWGLSVNGINPQNTKYSNKQRFSYQPSRRDDENDFIVTVTDGTHQVSTKLPVKHTFAKTSGLIKGRLAAGEINSGLDNDILKWDAHRNKVKLNLTLAPGEVCSRDVTLNSKPVDMLLLDINGDTLDDWLVFHNSSDGTLVKTYINKASNQNTGNNWNSSKCYWPFYKTPDFERKIQFKGLSGVKGVEGRQKRNDADRQVQYLLLHSDVHGQTQVLALVHSIKSNHENAKIQELKVVKSSIRKPQTQHILAADLSFLGSHHWSLMEGMHNSDAVAVAEVVIDKDEISSSDQSINFSDLKFQRTSYKLEKGKLVRNAIDLKLGSQHNWRVLKNTENSSAPKFSLINTNPEESSTQATFMPRNISVLWADLPQYSHPILMYSTEPDAFLTKSVDVHVNDNALLLQDKTKFSQHKNSTGIDYQKNFWVLNIPAQNTDHVGGNTYEKLPQGNKDRFLKVLEYASMSPQLNSEYSSIGIYIKKSSTNGLDRGPIFLKSLASKALTAKFNNREKKVYITTLKMYYSGTTEDGKGIVFTRGIGISAEMGLSIIKCENTTDPKQKDAHVKLEKTDDRCKFDYIIPKSVYENLLGNKKSDEFEIKLTFEKDAQETAEFNFVLKIEFDQKRLSVKEPGELKVHNGSTLDPVVIQIYDANDIISQNTDGDRVSVTVFNSEGQQEKAVINGNKLVTIKNGEAIFTDLSVQGNVGATYTLVFKAQLDGKVTSVTKDIAILPPRPNLAPIPKIIDIVKVKGGSSDDFSQTLYKIVFDKEVKFEEGKAVDSSSADRLIHTPMPDSRSNELYFTHLVIGGHNAKTFKLNLFNGATIRSIGGIDADLSYAVKLADPPKVSVKFNNNKPNTFTWEWSSVNGNSVVYRYRKQGETSWTDAQQGQTSYELKDANGIQTLYVQEQDEQGDWSLSGFAKGIIPKIQVVEYSYQPDPNKRKLEIKIDPMVREGLNFSFVMSVDIENAKQIDAYYDGFGGSHLIGVANVALAKESDWPEVKKISTKSMTFGPHHFGPADTTWTYMNPNQCYRLAIQQQANEAVLPTTDFKLNVLNDNNKEKNTVKIHLFKNFDETKISLKKNQGMFGKANIDNYGNFVYSIDQDINEDFFVSKKDKFTFVLKNNGNSCEFYATVTLFSDPLYGRQWHHKNLKVEPVHNDGITGKGVTVAVLDSGLNTEHKDLKDNIILNGAWEKNTDGKVVWTDELRPRDGQTHGTNVAVILGAIGWNNLGGRGIAPSVKLKGINLIDEVYTEALINGLGYDGKLADVDIFNLSFGLGPISQNKSFKDQLWKSVLNFRNGKGAIYVKASGNSYKNHMSPYTASSCPMSEKHNLTCENTAFDLLNNHPAIINVAALTLKDVATSFSTQGAANWVSAPGEYVLIDANSSKELVSVSEDLNIDHMSSKNVDGTSFSSPMVTGVVALMLEANPALTWREVKHILAATARKVDNKNRVRRQVTVDGIDVEPGWITNKAGYHFHNAYGFGAVDADAAVKMAKGYHQRPEQLGQFNKDQYKELGGDIDEALKPNDLKTIRVKQANKGKIETLIVTIKLKDFFFPSDLSIALVSPSKTRSVLLSPFNALSKINDVLELSTNAFYGEEMQGDWEIQIYDHLEDNSNTFEYRTEFQKGIISLIKFTPELGSWKLKFYGSTAVPEKSNNF